MWFPLATPLNARGSGCKCHIVTSCCFKSWSAGEISQQRHGSFPQFPSIFITLTFEGRVMCMNDSKSDAGEQQAVARISKMGRKRVGRRFRGCIQKKDGREGRP